MTDGSVQSAPATGLRPSFPAAELDYELPADLIAQAPAEDRAESRLLVLDRDAGTLTDRGFRDLPDVLRDRDLLVMNNTRVIPARFSLRRATGGRIEGLFLHERNLGLWEVMLKNAARTKLGEALRFEAEAGAHRTIGVPQVMMHHALGQGRYLIEVVPPAPATTILAAVGRPPLPPYIHRGPQADERDALDGERYQTIYARRPGAVAAPTAGLHFTPELLAELAGRGRHRAEVTLHVGAGTFAPITVDELAEHTMHEEWYELTDDIAQRINAHRAGPGRVVAVGTTSVRVLESCVDARCAAALDRRPGGFDDPRSQPVSRISPGSGWTRIFCYPPYRFRAVDALLTNFHLPRSTLLALVMAFAGVEPARRAYRHAVAERYRFFSFGDAMLIQ